MQAWGAYTASKHGLAGCSKSLAIEVGKAGITVNYILPGAIVTGITRDLREADADFITGHGLSVAGGALVRA